MAKSLAKASWPGWFTDQQLAGEYAQQLARQLSASVNAGQLAAAWLALHGTDTTQPASAMDDVAKARRRKRPRRRSGGQQQQPTAQQPQPVTPPRQFLIAQGVTAAIAAIITSLLTQLWGAALTMGWASAVMVLGVGQVEGAERALARLLAAGQGRIAGIVATRVSRLERVLLAALRDGISVDELAQQIRDILGSLTSALLVTQSETTWASGWAAYWVYKLTGVKWVKWQTRNDGRVCGRCRANQAASPIRLGQKFPSGDKRPLAHPRCVIGSTRVAAPSVAVTPDETQGFAFDLIAPPARAQRDGGQVAAPAVAIADRDFGRANLRAVTDREYVGDVVTIRTASGKELTATPNHPVATGGRWVAIAELAVGDHVLSSTGAEWEAPAVHPDVDDVPPRIEEVAQALPVLLDGVPTAAEDFHGDGAGSEVCIVRTNSLLVDDAEAGTPESTGQCLLCGGDVAAGSTLAFDAESLGEQELLRLGDAPAHSMGSINLAGPLSGTHLGPLHSLGLTATAWRNSRFGENDPDVRPLYSVGGRESLLAFSGEIPGYDLFAGTPEACTLGAVAAGNVVGLEDAEHLLVADTDGFCDLLGTLAAGVAADEIVHVNRWMFSGHVYNLDTVEGWYIGNGIVTHNCRCSLLPAAAPKAATQTT